MLLKEQGILIVQRPLRGRSLILQSTKKGE